MYDSKKVGCAFVCNIKRSLKNNFIFFNFESFQGQKFNINANSENQIIFLITRIILY